MELIQRFRAGNTYDDGAVQIGGRWHRRRRTILGGVPNVPIDRNGNLAPLDNTLDVITTHPLAGYVVKQGPFWLGFHDKMNNQYASAVRLLTGEQMVVRLNGQSPSVTPTVHNGHTLEWNYGAAGWIRQYATERCVKEVLLQKAGRTISFRYSMTGLTPSLSDDRTQAIMRRSNGQVAFTIARPYYITAQGEWDGWAPVSWTQDGDDYVVTLAAPDTDRLVDPTINFGEGSGMTGGDHKDTFLQSNGLAAANGGRGGYYLGRSGTVRFVYLARFSLDGHIATGATVNAAILHVFLSAAPTAEMADVGCHKMTTDWGVSPTDEGATENPATGGQATWGQSFDYDGGVGEQNWANGTEFSSSDYDAAEDTTTIGAAANIGDEFTWSVPLMAADWVADDAANLGLCLFYDTLGNYCQIDSQESATVAERPYLAVDYVVPVAASGGGGGIAGGIAVGIGVGIGF